VINFKEKGKTLDVHSRLRPNYKRKKKHLLLSEITLTLTETYDGLWGWELIDMNYA